MTRTTTPSKRNDRGRKMPGWGGLFAWIAVAGFAAALFCPAAQAADWSTKVSGETLACNVVDTIEDFVGRWQRITIRYFIQGKDAAYQAYLCYATGVGLEFTCFVSGSSTWSGSGGKTLAVEGNLQGTADDLIRWQVTKRKTCSELYSILQIKVTASQ